MKGIANLALPFIIILLALPMALNAAKYAGEIFQIEPGAVNQAMGNTGLTDPYAISAAWWNPALISSSEQGIELMHAEEFDGLMQFNSIAAVFNKENRQGLIITHIGIDDIALTELANEGEPISEANQPQISKHVNNNDLMLYYIIGREIKPDFYLGITPKLAYRFLAEHSGYGFGADLGVFLPSLFQSHLTGLAEAEYSLGVAAKNFFTTQLIWENGTTETALPELNAELGCKMMTKWKIPVHTAFGFTSQFEGRVESATVNLGAWSADFHAGVSVQPISKVKIMAGYDVDAFTTGLGLDINKLALAYSIKFGSQDDLGYSQRLSAGWRW
ncbi:MAG: hypothetical protein ACE14O_06120 [Candidatus Cloacimonadaceae bacterium]